MLFEQSELTDFPVSQQSELSRSSQQSELTDSSQQSELTDSAKWTFPLVSAKWTYRLVSAKWTFPLVLAKWTCFRFGNLPTRLSKAPSQQSEFNLPIHMYICNNNFLCGIQRGFRQEDSERIQWGFRIQDSACFHGAFRIQDSGFSPLFMEL